MKLTQISKISRRRGPVAVLVLMLALGTYNVAQAWQPQVAKTSPSQPVTGTVHIQNAVIVPPGTHFGHVNHARVELPFPPCYSVDYKSGPGCNCYGDQPQQGDVAIGVHLFSN